MKLMRITAFVIVFLAAAFHCSESLIASSEIGFNSEDESFFGFPWQFSESAGQKIIVERNPEKLFDAFFDMGKALGKMDRNIDAAHAFHRAGIISFPSSAKYEAIFEGGLSWFEAGEFDRAVREFQTVESSLPGTPLAGEACYWAAEASVRLGKPAEALGFYRKAAETARGETVSYAIYGTALCLAGQGDAGGGIAALENALKSAPPDSLKRAAVFGLAALNFSSGRNDDSKSWAEIVLKDGEGDETARRAHLILGELAAGTGAAGDASYHFKMAMDGETDDGLRNQALYGLGWVTLSSGQPGQAVQYFEALGAGSPTDEMRNAALYAKSVCLTDLGRYADAITALKDLLSRGKTGKWTESAWLALAYNYLAAGELTKSVQTLDTFLNNFPDSEFRSQAEFLTAEVLYREKRYSDAIEAYRKRVYSGNNPLQDDALFRIGFAYFRLKNYLGARDSWRELLRLYPQSKNLEETRFWLAEAEFRLGSYAESLKLFEELQRRNPSGDRAFDALYGAAWSSYRLKDFRQALWSFKKALEDYPSSGKKDDIEFRIANCYYNLRDREKAAGAYESLIKEYPESKFVNEALMNTGLSFYRDEKFDEAIRTFVKLAEKDNSGALGIDATFWAADSYSRKGDYGSASGLLKKIADTPSIPESLRVAAKVRSADALFNAGNVSGAGTLYREVLDHKSPPELTESAYYGLVRSLDAQGLKDEATKVSTELAEKFPSSSKSAEFLIKSGEADMRAGNYQAALNSLEKVAKITSSQEIYFRALLLIGRTNFLLRKYDSSLGSYEKAFSSDDRYINSSAHLGAGVACWKKGDLSRAAAEFEKSIAFAPNSDAGITSKFDMGKVYLELGDTARAENTWQEFLLNWGGETQLAGEANFWLGMIQRGRRDYGKAAESFGRAAQNLTAVRGAESQYWKGQCYFDAGDLRKAIIEYRKVSDLYSGYPLWDIAARFKIGECYEGLGMWKEARDEYSLIMREAPDKDSVNDAGERIKWIEEKQK